jgi:membrane-associated phospholipid phosphatase
MFIRQLALVVGAVLAYFGVRGLTEGNEHIARANAANVLALQRRIGIAIETTIQEPLTAHRWLLDLANWAYIWLHWPLLIGTLLWFVIAEREAYTRLRNAMFFSGCIGLVIFASFPVAPPRLFSAAYVDTVTLHSVSYRVLQPPALVNAYAAMPSLHVGWNLLVGIMWWQVLRNHRWRYAGVLMPVVMGWATVATGNHWILDAVGGSVVAVVGLTLEWLRRRIFGVRQREQVSDLVVAHRPEVPVVGTDGAEVRRRFEHDVLVGGVSEVGFPPGRRHRDSEEDTCGSSLARHMACRTRSRTRRDAVVDHHDEAAVERM